MVTVLSLIKKGSILGFLLFRYGTNNLRLSLLRSWGVNIGSDCRIFDCDFGSEPYLISIGNHCEITAGVTFITHDGATWVFRGKENYNGTKFGAIKIHDNCFIGMNSTILPCVEIGPNSIIGAGSVVTKKVLPNSVYAGNPARLICSIDDYFKSCMSKNTGLMPSYRSPEERVALIKQMVNSSQSSPDHYGTCQLNQSEE